MDLTKYGIRYMMAQKDILWQSSRKAATQSQGAKS
jgi:hypothetical protein